MNNAQSLTHLLAGLEHASDCVDERLYAVALYTRFVGNFTEGEICKRNHQRVD